MKKKYIHPLCKGHELKTTDLICESNGPQKALFINNAAEGGVSFQSLEYDDDNAAAGAKGGRSFFDE